MQVITTHVSTDFDALGAMLAAHKLYPQSTPCFPGHISRPVREFYSLYKDALPIKTTEMLNLDIIDELIVVDTQQVSRMGRFGSLVGKPGVRTIIYDHHQAPEEPLPADVEVYQEQIGAITSFLVNQIQERQISLTQLEATVMALGIYADTACLTTAATTGQDVAAVGYLLAQGANLEIVGRHLNGPLSQPQRQLLEELLANSERHSYHGASVLITVCAMDEYVDGLGLLTERLATIEDVDLVFCLVEMGNRIHMTGRSLNHQIPINEVMMHFGGGGHPQAAAATVKGKTLSELRQQLMAHLAENLPAPFTAVDLMSAPVHATNPNATMQEVGQTMLRYGHSGLPVLQDSQLVGIISRRDVDKSIHHGLQHAPVKAFMSTRVVTVSPQASLAEIQRLLVSKDVGRLPVVDEQGRVLGIVTRSDVLRALHGYSYPYWYQSASRPLLDARVQPGHIMLTELMTEKLPQKMQGTLLIIGKEAEQQKVNAYLVGGVVRDLLLDVPNLDVDIVVEPAAIPFAEHLAKIFGAAVTTYPQFNTATLDTPDGSIDLVTARTEFYAAPAAVPDVEASSIKHDLYRRDFTINTMAIALTGSRYGQLIDYFGGLADLEAGVIRVLYNLSFVEDPSRILRAIRFEQRYGFQIETETMRFLQNAVEHNLLRELPAEKMRTELVQMMNEDRAPHMILRMDELGIWPEILPGFSLSDQLARHIQNTKHYIDWLDGLQTGARIDRSLVYLLLLVSQASADAVRQWIGRLALTKRERDLVLSFVTTQEQLVEGLARSASDHEIYDLLHNQSIESQVVTAVLQGESVRQQLARYWSQLADVHPETDGYDLIGLGLKPGPQVGEVLRKIHMARLNGQVTTKEQELELARQLLTTPKEGR